MARAAARMPCLRQYIYRPLQDPLTGAARRADALLAMRIQRARKPTASTPGRLGVLFALEADDALVVVDVRVGDVTFVGAAAGLEPEPSDEEAEEHEHLSSCGPLRRLLQGLGTGLRRRIRGSFLGGTATTSAGS